MPYSTILSGSVLQRLQQDGDVLVFDCGFDLADPEAGKAAWREGHVPGARYIHLDHDLSGPMTGTNGRHPLPDAQVFAAKMRAAGLRAGQQVVAYDAQGGPYAARLWWLLRWLGHEAVAVLDGGRQAWVEAEGAVEAGEVSVPAAGDFTTEGAAWNATISAADVLANITNDGNLLIVDARAPERFRGDPNPLDPVAGHIPGAANRFFKDNLTADGRFKSPEILAAEWQAVLGDGRPAGAAIMQCGSGVTACHNLLALEIARMPWAKLYPGSWSEWISDPARPIAFGSGG